jgi:pimeloyl-ACP methyl ester carboxylesterase
MAVAARLRQHGVQEVKTTMRIPACLLAALLFAAVSSAPAPARADALFRNDLTLTVHGQKVHVQETYSSAALQRFPRRGVLLLPGPVVNAAWFNMPVEGFDAGAILAREGYFAFAMDLPGEGGSEGPADGRDTTLAYDLDVSEVVIDRLRLRRLIPRLDVYGEGSSGGSLALLLGGEPLRVRSIACSAMLYVAPTPLAEAAVLSPEYRAFLDAMTPAFGYYLPTPPEAYAPFVAAAGADVQAYTAASQPGLYPTGTMYELLDEGLPLVDPADGRVPGLFIWGAHDFVAEPGDVAALAADYGSIGGGEGQYVELADGGHVSRVEQATGAGAGSPFWSALLSFLACD